MSAAIAGPFEPTWASLENYRVPDWYMDAKFGIFIHWGVYSVPAFGNEWYPRNMYVQGSPEFEHHVKTWGKQNEFGYKDFIPMFGAERYDPAAWAALFKRSGARYVMPVAEHHDGFAMYDSALSEWTATKMGPKRDVVGELAQAVRQEGLVFCASSHRAEHWWFMNGGRSFDSDVQDPRYADFYGPATPIANSESHAADAWKSQDWRPRPDGKFLEDWLARCCELVDKYRPQVVWFDWWIEQAAFEPYVQRFAAYYYNRGLEWGQGVAINYKLETFPTDAAVFDIERGQATDIIPDFWQTDTSISKNSWGYVAEQNYKTAKDVIGDLADIVSKNGCLLLNIGPRPDGTIPEPEVAILEEIGDWLAVNGEAIYGTRPWVIYGEGPTQVVGGSFHDTDRHGFTAEDIRFTTRGDALYAIVLGRPEGDEIAVRSLAEASAASPKEISNVELLGYTGALTWARNSAGLVVTLPASLDDAPAYALKIT
jgi:alpha-L-fucosidase